MNFGFFEIFANILAWFYSIIPSYGLAIVLLTLVSRILLLPLSIKSTRSMREMQVIQPEIKALQKKHKGDRQKLNTEMMALYKEHGVNPFGGCAPLLLQMPVFIALYQVISGSVKYLAAGSALLIAIQQTPLRVHQFLGFRLDCSATKALAGDASEVPLRIVDGETVDMITEACGSGGVISALPYLLLILAMGGTTYYQQRQMMAARGGSTDPQQQQMQTFMKVMPLVLVVIGIGFPAGVVVYWLTTNAWTIVQQRIMLKAAPPVTATTKTGAKKAAAAKKTTAGKTTAGKSDGKSSKAQLKGGPGQPPRKATDKKSPSGKAPGSRGGSRKKKR